METKEPGCFPWLGTTWIGVGEATVWKVVGVDEPSGTVELSGPWPCRGLMTVDAEEFKDGKWRRI